MKIFEIFTKVSKSYDKFSKLFQTFFESFSKIFKILQNFPKLFPKVSNFLRKYFSSSRFDFRGNAKNDVFAFLHFYVENMTKQNVSGKKGNFRIFFGGVRFFFHPDKAPRICQNTNCISSHLHAPLVIPQPRRLDVFGEKTS